MWTDGRTYGRVERNTDTTNLIVTFHNSANLPNKKEQKVKGLQNTNRRGNHSDYNKVSNLLLNWY